MKALEDVVYVSRTVEVQTAPALWRIVDTARMLNRRPDLTERRDDSATSRYTPF